MLQEPNKEFQEAYILFVEAEEQVLCQFCGMAIAPEDVVFCCKCQTAHHRDCWCEGRVCTTFACGCTRALDRLDVLDVLKSLPARSSSKKAVVFVIDDEEVQPSQLTQVPLPPSRFPKAWEVIKNEGRSIVKINMMTYAEFAHRIIAVVGVLGIFLLGSLGLPAYKMGALGLLSDRMLGAYAIFSIWIILFVILPVTLCIGYGTFYAVDLHKGVLYYRRLLFGFNTGYKLGKISDICTIAVKGVRFRASVGFWWLYFPVVVFNDGRVFRIAGFENTVADANLLAKAFAELLRCSFSSGLDEQYLSVISEDNGECSVIYYKHEWRQNDLKLSKVVLILFVFFSIIGYLIYSYLFYTFGNGRF